MITKLNPALADGPPEHHLALRARPPCLAAPWGATGHETELPAACAGLLCEDILN